MNNPLVDDLSETAADHLQDSSGEDGTLRKVYLASLGRLPDSEEKATASSYLKQMRNELGMSENRAWASYLKQLFSSAEFRYLY